LGTIHSRRRGMIPDAADGTGGRFVLFILLQMLLIHRYQYLELIRSRRSAQGLAISKVDALLRAAARTKNALGKGSGRLHINRIVQQDQGLEGRVGTWPLHGALFTTGRIERHETGMRKCPAPIGIQTAAIE